MDTAMIANNGTSHSAPIPLPVRNDISIRVAKPSDLAFVDSLQKMHAKMVGFLSLKIFEAKISLGEVLIAEEVRGQSVVSGPLPVAGEEQKNPHPNPPPEYRERENQGAVVCPPLSNECREKESLATNNCQLTTTPVGYCLGQDRYFKRDDVGIIYQLNVLPGRQRGLVGASLLKGMFERAAWGCKLFCCWCAQDLEANRFWEAMGFVPLAFRAGSRGKRRVHIFWQGRIRSGDAPPNATPYWFPSQTSAGALGENRLVLPIPPGTHWSDAKPLVLPGLSGVEGPEEEGGGHPSTSSTGSVQASSGQGAKALPGKRERRPKEVRVATVGGMGGLRFGAVQVGGDVAKEKVKEPRKKTRNDPKLVAAARELRDRWLEEVNAGAAMLVGNGKYDVSRQIEGMHVEEDVPAKQIEVKHVMAIAA